MSATRTGHLNHQRSASIALALFFLAVAHLHAGIASSPEPANEPTGPKAYLAERGISFPLSYTAEGFANLSGGFKRGTVFDGLVKAGLQLDLEKLLAWPGATFCANGLYPHGTSLTQRYTHDFNTVSNIDAYDSIRLYELWLEQNLAEGKLSIRIGQLPMDTEFFVSDYGALFLNSVFGAIPVVSMNVHAPVYPIATPGARVRATLGDQVTLQAGVFDGNQGKELLDHGHGFEWHLDGDEGVVAILEAAYRTHPGAKSEGLKGTYKLGGFWHSATFEDNTDNNSHHGNFGGYFIADQQIWKPAADAETGLGAFLSVGSAPTDRNTVCFYCDGGLNYKGLLPNRPNDTLGVGLSYTRLSQDLRGDDGEPLEAHHETILEITYQIAVTDWFSVQPDFQWIFNPGATEPAPDAIVAGIRCTATF